MRNLLYVLFIQGKWGLKKWQVSNISVLELYERPHQNFFVFEPEWCLFAKAAKKQIFSVSSTSAFYCTCISYNRSTFFQLFHSVQWLLKKMCLDFFLFYIQRHLELLHLEMLLPTVELSKKVNQWMVVTLLWNSFLVYLETWKIKVYILLHIYYFLSIDW